MNNLRPKNLNLFTIHQPLPAIVSILHRISGFLLFLLIPVMLWGFYLSLKSPNDFESVRAFFSTPWMKGVVWVVLSAFLYHFVAGIRHLLMDLEIGIELKSGRISSLITCLVSVILILLAGLWLW